MNLYLVQHAEAKSKQEDPERPLSEEGRTNIGKVATYVAEHTSLRVQQIVHSGKVRTQQTAEILAKALLPPRGSSRASHLAPLDEPSRWAERLNSVNEDIMLVGHLPHLSNLAALLICDNVDQKVIDFQNGGIVCLTRDDDAVWAVRWIVTPEIVS